MYIHDASGHVMSHDAHMIGVGEFPNKFKVLSAVDVSVPHELEVVFVHLVLDHGRHRVIKEVTSLAPLYQSLGRREMEGEEGREMVRE